MPDIKLLKKLIKSHDYTVGVIGLGYVGLPLLLYFGEAGFRIIGFDVDPVKVKSLNRGLSYIGHVPENRLTSLVESGKFEATADFGRLGEADAILICVPTPLTRYREPDLQYVERTAEAVSRTIRRGQLICLESTTYPGTTEEILLPLLTARGLKAGEDFFLAYSPEREDPGNQQYPANIIPKIISGITPKCLEVASTLYGQVFRRIVKVSTTRAAESTKLLENIYRAVNIALVNELKVTFERMGIDIWEVIEAASTKPFGFQPFYPGPGLGGHCLPIDPFYLTWKAREYGVATRFVELAGEINNAMPAYVVGRLSDALNVRKKALHGSKILILGVAYKKDVGDLRESPALEIMGILLGKGAQVDYSDPFLPSLTKGRRHDFRLKSVPVTLEVIQRYDGVVLVTDHSTFPYELVYNTAPLIVDCRNAFRQRGFTGRHVIGA